MYKIAAACFFLLQAAMTVAQAQEQSNEKFFYTRQGCDEFTKIVSTVKRYGEEPLFTGQGMQFDYEGTPFTGGSMFFVNQDSGSWSLVTLYGDGYACMTAVGVDFEPYGG